jgi:Mce-associated membrane protein
MPKATGAAVQVADPPVHGAASAASTDAVDRRDELVGAAAEGSRTRSRARTLAAWLARVRLGTKWLRRSRLSGRTVLLAGLTVLLLALWATGGWLVGRERAADAAAEQRTAALSTAQKVATDLTSITGDNAQAQIAALTQESTGAFHTQISSYGAALSAILRQAKAGSTGTVSAAGIERMDAVSASALVAVSAKVSNSALPTGRPVSYRMVVQLRREGDRWLASDVRFLP